MVAGETARDELIQRRVVEYPPPVSRHRNSAIRRLLIGIRQLHLRLQGRTGTGTEQHSGSHQQGGT